MKFLRVFVLFLLAVTLYACTDGVKATHEQVFSTLSLTYAQGEDKDSVTKDIALAISDFKGLGVTLEWESSDDTHAQISDDSIVITRPKDANIAVTITARVTINDVTESQTFSFTILKEDSNIVEVTVTVHDKEVIQTYKINKGSIFTMEDPVKEGFVFKGLYTDEAFTTLYNNEVINEAIDLYVCFEAVNQEDVTAPVITGTKELFVLVGGPIDLLSGVSALDDVDGQLAVSVDDSKLDLSKVGIYEVIYRATDEAGNEAIIKVNIHVESATSSEAFIETFDLAPSTGSSYKDGDFVGVNGFKWTFKGMRSDQMLDGDALTFGASSANYLKANLQGGLSELSIDFKHAFSGNDIRVLELYINNQLVHTFEVDAEGGTLKATDLNIEGDYEFELRNTGGNRVIVDNISITPNALSVEAKAIQLDIKNFSFPSIVMEETTLSFERSGLQGSTITYAFSDPNNANNALMDLNNGLVKMPTDRQVTVLLTVTFSLLNESKSIQIEVTLGEGDPITVSEALIQSGAVKFTGTLIAFYEENQQIRAFFQDQSKAIEVLLSSESQSNLEIGYTYTIKGYVDHSGYTKVNQVSSLTKGMSKAVISKPITVDNLSDHLSQMVNFKGVVLKDYTEGDLSILINDGVILTQSQVTNNPFIGLAVGESLNITGIVVKTDGTYKVIVLDETKVVKHGFDKVMFESYLLEGLELADYIETQIDLDLKTIDPIFGLTIEWVSSNPSVMSNQGVITEPEEPVSLVLNYTVKQGTAVVYQSKIEVTVSTGIILSAYYQEAQGLTGSDLVSALTSIISTGYKGISYKATNAVLEVADKYPNGNGYLGIYDHKSITSYNKEHVWPQSSFSKASPYVSDMHHLRISNSKTNSTRSNYYFNEPLSSTSSWEVGSSRFYPGELDKGDIARMLMYMAVRYRNDGFKLIVAQSGRTSDAPARTMGNLAVLLDWHLEDPVDNFEINRNNVIYGTQKNRNPFIDHPELFEEVFDVFMAEDKQRRQGASKRVEKITLEVDLTVSFDIVAMLPQVQLQNKEWLS